jgi:xanthine dehydrogenase accessory factor
MRDVLRDVLAWSERGERVVFAILVRVDRSAPLAPGAAMAVGDSGAVSGSISGGCVEPALYGEATRLLDRGGTTLVSYGIADEAAFDVGLTCGGTIEVMLTRLEEAEIRVLGALAKAIDADRPAALGVVLNGREAGRLALVAGESETATLADRGLAHAVMRDARGAVESGASGMRTYGEQGGSRPDEVAAFVRAFAAAPDMLIFGAIDFAGALSRLGRFLGYRVTVCDARATFVTPERFPDAHRVVAQWPHEFLSEAPVDVRTAICVLTHDPKFDIPVLQAALATPAGYIGAMGSRRTHDERTRALRELGVDAGDLARISGPIGLDLGATTPEEVAVAIAAEIVALRNGASAGRLAERAGPVHGTRQGTLA